MIFPISAPNVRSEVIMNGTKCGRRRAMAENALHGSIQGRERDSGRAMRTLATFALILRLEILEIGLVRVCDLIVSTCSGRFAANCI